MIEALNNVEAITVFTDDVAASREFYAAVFAATIVYEEDESCMFQVGSLIVNVTDVDAVCAELRDRGVELVNGPSDRPWGRRTALFLDPSGLPWEVAQELG